MIKNLIYDWGKVLVEYDFMELVCSIEPDPVENEKLGEILCSMEYLNRCDKGDDSYIEIIHDYQRRYPKWTRQLQEFYDRQPDAFTAEVPGMRDLLNKLRAQGFKLYGLTNWGDTVYRVIRKFSILEMMDDRVISSEEKLIKPSAAIFNRLCEKFSLKPEECVFTDDRQINVDGARAVGMKAILFKDAKQYEAELNEILKAEN